MAISTRKVQQKRLPTSVERRFKIVNFGADNLYPQTSEEISFRSPVTESAINTLSDFLYGEGFLNGGDIVVNRYEQTLNDILKEVTDDVSLNNGWALHFNTNTLGYITEIFHIKFKDCRFGLPDKNGRHLDIKYSVNWEEVSGSKNNIESYIIWNKRKFFENLEGVQEKGFVFYWTPKIDTYPRCTFDSVLDSSQTDGEIQVFELASIQNGFLGTSIFKKPGKFGSEKEKNRAVQELTELTGAENSGSVLIIETPVNFDGNLIEQIPANNNDKLFEATNRNVINRIVSAFGTPYPLLGIIPQNTGLFNQEQMEDSYIYYNARTRKQRTGIAKEFNKFLKYWWGGSVNVVGIKENQFKIVENGADDNKQE